MTDKHMRKELREPGKPIMDATEKIRGTVVPDDIANAIPHDAEHCVYANACVREFKVLRATIMRRMAYLEFDDRIVRYAVPRSMEFETTAFDRGGQWGANEFYLGPPPPSDRLGKRPRRGSNKRSGKTREPRHLAIFTRGAGQ